MSKAVEGYEELIRLKRKELEQYYLRNKEIIKPFLQIQKEMQELGSKAINARMNIVDELLKNKNNE